MIYEYECPNCGILEFTMSYADYKNNPPSECPECPAQITRIFSPSMGFVKDVKTVGQYAEKKMKTLTKEQGKVYEQMIAKEEAKSKTKMDGPPKHIRKAIKQGDQKTIDTYIEKGI